jgi:hypothetical protein
MSEPWFSQILWPVLRSADGEAGLTPEVVLQAVRAWDQQQMWERGRSVMPTDLRDAVYAVLSPAGRLAADLAALSSLKG